MEFKKTASSFKGKNKKSYAAINNLTTISKLRIQKPFNQYDSKKTYMLSLKF